MTMKKGQSVLKTVAIIVLTGLLALLSPWLSMKASAQVDDLESTVTNADYNAETGVYTFTFDAPKGVIASVELFKNGSWSGGTSCESYGEEPAEIEGHLDYPFGEGNYKVLLMVYADSSISSLFFSDYLGGYYDYSADDMITWAESMDSSKVVCIQLADPSYGDRGPIEGPEKVWLTRTKEGGGTLHFTAVPNALWYDVEIYAEDPIANKPYAEIDPINAGSQVKDTSFGLNEGVCQQYSQIWARIRVRSANLGTYMDSDWITYGAIATDVSGDNNNNNNNNTDIPGGKRELVEEVDGGWGLYIDYQFASEYSDLFYDKNVGWWKVYDGWVDFSYSDLYNSPEYGWWKILNGAVDFGYNDLYNSETCGMWVVKDGAVDFEYNGEYKSATYGTWYVENGQAVRKIADPEYQTGALINGLAPDANGVWYAYDAGNVLTGFNDLYCDPVYGWWLVLDGRVAFDYNDLFYSPTYGWWKINGGAVDFEYNDLYCSSTLGWWKIADGTVDFAYTDLYDSGTYGLWVISGGAVDFGYNGEYKSAVNGNWYVENGQAIRKTDNGQNQTGALISGLAADENGIWRLYDAGKVLTDFNDLYCDPTYGWWLVTNGTVNFEYNDLFYSPTYGWWLITGGTVNFAYNDLFGSPTVGWWKIADGTVDFGYNDLFGSPVYGWWLVSGGAVNFGYNDLFGSSTVGWWKVSGGSVDFGYNDIFDSPGLGKWKINGGAVDFGYTGEYNSAIYGKVTVSSGQVTAVSGGGSSNTQSSLLGVYRDNDCCVVIAEGVPYAYNMGNDIVVDKSVTKPFCLVTVSSNYPEGFFARSATKKSDTLITDYTFQSSEDVHMMDMEYELSGDTLTYRRIFTYDDGSVETHVLTRTSEDPKTVYNALIKDATDITSGNEGGSGLAKDSVTAGSTVTLGSYEQDGNTSNGKESIEWKVLKTTDDKALLISKYVLDNVTYNNTQKAGITWDECSLRTWLNNDFYNTAFSSDEKNCIATTTLVNNTSASYTSRGGVETTDNVFCLSIDEVRELFSFEYWGDNAQTGNSSGLIADATAYAKSVNGGALTTETISDEYAGFYPANVIGTTGAGWWLRTPGYNYDNAWGVYSNGQIGTDLYSRPNLDNVGVRPAIWVNLQ